MDVHGVFLCKGAIDRIENGRHRIPVGYTAVNNRVPDVLHIDLQIGRELLQHMLVREQSRLALVRQIDE